MKLYVAQVAVGDDVNEPQSELLGCYSTEERAWEVAVANGPRTASVDVFELDSQGLYGDAVRWVVDGAMRRRGA